MLVGAPPVKGLNILFSLGTPPAGSVTEYNVNTQAQLPTLALRARHRARPSAPAQAVVFLYNIYDLV